MEHALRIARYSVFAAVALAACVGASAGTLYKSVDKDGRVTFSDKPVEGAVTLARIDTSDSAKPVESASAPVYLALADSFDEAVTQANAKLDMAERALATARRGIVEHNPLSLHAPRLSRAESQQLDFYKRDVNDARRNLMRVLKQRNTMVSFRPLA